VLNDLKVQSTIEYDEKNPKACKTTPVGIKSRIRGNLEFRNVSFKYPGKERLVFDKLNIQINKGQHVALVGNFENEKSALLDVIMRFYEVNSGIIMLDGVNLKEYDLHHLRSAFGTINQKSQLFNGTIIENITYKETALTFENVRVAAQHANASESISSLPAGFNSELTAKGNEITLNQRQRIAIARTIAQKPVVYLIEDIKSLGEDSYDQRTEVAIKKVSSFGMTIKFTNQISKAKYADNIYMLRKGSVVRQGSYNKILAEENVNS